jgi:hypothetical protein
MLCVKQRREKRPEKSKHLAMASAPTGTGVASSETGRRSEESTRSKADVSRGVAADDLGRHRVAAGKRDGLLAFLGQGFIGGEMSSVANGPVSLQTTSRTRSQPRLPEWLRLGWWPYISGIRRLAPVADYRPAYSRP